MRKVLFLSLITALVVVPMAIGDTLHLKNGSVLKGKVTNFADDQFTVMLDTGSGRSLSKATVYMGDVARIEFDSAAAAPGSDTASIASQPTEAPSRVTEHSARETKLRNTPPVETAPRNTQPSEPQPREVGPPDSPPRETKTPSISTSETPARSSQLAEPHPGDVGPPDAQPTTSRETATSQRETLEKDITTLAKGSDNNRSLSGQRGKVKSATVELPGRRDSGRDWMSSQLIVEVGDRVRITATGTIVLDATGTRTVGPEGISLPDRDKLLQDRPTGAVIGVIGSSDDEYFFIGKATEFTATRRGLLFLAVNEGNLADNSGSFTVSIEVQQQHKTGKPD